MILGGEGVRGELDPLFICMTIVWSVMYDYPGRLFNYPVIRRTISDK
jgi:hypothetical protein